MSKSIEFLNNLAKQLQEQDNLYTASPNYCIQEKELICGVVEDYGGKIGWFSEEATNPEEENSRKHRALERYYDKYGKEPEGWTRCGYRYEWVYTGVSFLTHAEAHAYADGHGRRRHLGEIRVYVDSHCYNHEMREVRRLMAGPVQACIESLRQMVTMMDEGDEHGAGSEWHTQAKAAMEALDTAKEPHQ